MERTAADQEKTGNERAEEFMTENRIKAFYDLAEKFCRFVSEKEITEAVIPSLIEELMILYLSLLHLPDAKPETMDSQPAPSEPISIRVDEHISPFYWEAYDPYAEDSVVCGDIREDLSDIASDLKKGMLEYEEGRAGNAVFEWTFGFRSHFGRHMADVLRVLHILMTQNENAG